ncbi:MAG: class I SAM-dependent methyltransferase [Gemmatimonadales bacterium]
MYHDPWAPHGESLRDYAAGDTGATIVLYSDLGEREELPVAGGFRDPTSPVEQAALARCRGRVLDAGAGTGIHTLALQARGLDVTAIDFVPEAVEIMRRRGVRDARRADLFGFDGGPFDTILLFANGTGLAETVAGLDRLFAVFARLLRPGGQVLLDSTDLLAKGHPPTRADGRYVGELEFQIEYKGQKAPPFRQVYVDAGTLADRAAAGGWVCEIVERPSSTHYLARLTRAG